MLSCRKGAFHGHTYQDQMLFSLYVEIAILFSFHRISMCKGASDGCTWVAQLLNLSSRGVKQVCEGPFYDNIEESRPRLAFVVRGEAFRHGGRDRNDQVTNSSWDLQYEASMSHVSQVILLENRRLAILVVPPKRKTHMAI